MYRNRIAFLMLEYHGMPVGGYKVVFEYANRLVADGHEVCLVYPSFVYFWKSSLKRKLKMLFFFVWHLFFRHKGVRNWFPLSGSVREDFVFSLSEKQVPQADLYFATAMETADYLNRLKGVRPEGKFYLIQALEDWQWGRDAVVATWKYPLRKVAVSPWLQEQVAAVEEDSVLIENGIDRPGLNLAIDPQHRNKYLVMLLYHKRKQKGADDGLEALKLVRKKYPELRALWFGTPARPAGLPGWIDYYRQPRDYKLNDLYNEAAIYLAPSRSEGFGLTVGEAMCCGCAVVCTDAGGYLTMARNRETALVSPAGDWEALAAHVTELIENDTLRCKLAVNGHHFIQDFTWDVAYAKFVKLLDTENS